MDSARKVGDKRRDYGLGNYPSVDASPSPERMPERPTNVLRWLGPGNQAPQASGRTEANREPGHLLQRHGKQFWRDKRAGPAERRPGTWEGTITRMPCPTWRHGGGGDRARHVEAVLRPILVGQTGPLLPSYAVGWNRCSHGQPSKGFASGDIPPRWANGLKNGKSCQHRRRSRRPVTSRRCRLDETPEFLEAGEGRDRQACQERSNSPY